MYIDRKKLEKAGFMILGVRSDGASDMLSDEFAGIRIEPISYQTSEAIALLREERNLSDIQIEEVNILCTNMQIWNVIKG